MPTIRRSVHCSHCKEEGHNISTCDIFQIKFNLALVSETYSYIPNYKYSTHKVNLHQLAEFKSVYNKDIPFIIYSRYIISYPDNENNHNIAISEKKTIKEIKNYKLQKSININKEAQYYNDFRIRFHYYLNNILTARRDHYVLLTDFIKLFNHDYTDVTTRLNNEYTAQQQRWEHEREQTRILENIQSNIVNRELLPTLVDTPFHADNCPICLESLGDTNKTVLRCGHPLCTPCLLTITLRSASSQNAQSCFCSVCRAPFL